MVPKLTAKIKASALIAIVVFEVAGMACYGQQVTSKGFAGFAEQTVKTEKIYLHTDRSFYLCGEILWFKAYLVYGNKNLPDSNCKLAYVELLDPFHKPLLQAKIRMSEGFGNGSFSLPNSIASGNYILRAYSNWMKNFSPCHFFEKKITIVNTTTNLDSSIVHHRISYTVNFFPEGGNLVAGLENIIAFKITSDQNKGVPCRAVILDQAGDTITRFSTSNFGMGHFSFRPEPGKDYESVLTLDDGKVIRKQLPRPDPSGYVLHVSDTEANDLNILVREKGRDQDSSSIVFVILQHHGQITLARSQAIINGEARLIISKDSLEEGVSTITVFDQDRHPLCERLCFKMPAGEMHIGINSSGDSYRTRSMVTVDLSTSGKTALPVPGKMSVAVVRLDSLQQPDPGDISSYLWLASDLHGNVESPGFYFRKDNIHAKEALDDLLMTQGWRKFEQEASEKDRGPGFAYLPEISGHIITGKIRLSSTGLPAPNVLVYLSVPGRRIQLKGCLSDSSGFVHFIMNDLHGAGQLVLQTNSGSDSAYRLEILNPFSEQFCGDSSVQLHMDENYMAVLEAANLYIKAEEAYHAIELQKHLPVEIDSLPFYYKPDKAYRLDDYTRFTTMEEVLREYVAEVNVRKKAEKFRFVMINSPARPFKDRQPIDLFFENDPLVLLDGVPVFDMDKVIAYDPLKLQKLEVVASKYYWGPITAYGIMSLTTYKGDLGGFRLNPSDLALNYDGLQQQRIFYSPDYSSPDAVHSHRPDFRTTLYWSPDVSTGENGKAGFSFYTGDIPGKYMVTVQGIGPGGEPASSSWFFNVQK